MPAPTPATDVSFVDRVDQFQRRHPAAGYPIAVIYKYVDDSGGNLAALITYFGFLAIFPSLLLMTTILGLVLSGDPGAQQAVLDSALSSFPVIGQSLEDPERLGGGLTGLLVGGLGALYGALGVTLAAQNAMNTAWSVPRNQRPNPVLARGRGLLLLATVGLALIVAAALATLGANTSVFGPWARTLCVAGGVAVNAAAFVVAFRIATARSLSVRDVAPGAIAAAVLWQLLQSFGALYVQRVVQGASNANGVFALVIGLVAFIYLTSTVVLLCVEANVVRVERLYPRALLTPFTDGVELTEGDRRAYTRAAKAQRAKGFQQILVRFRKGSDDQG